MGPPRRILGAALPPGCRLPALPPLQSGIASVNIRRSDSSGPIPNQGNLMGCRPSLKKQNPIAVAVRVALVGSALCLALPAMPAAAQSASPTIGQSASQAASGNVLLAQTVPPPAQGTEENPANPAPILSEVVVTGFRESLAKATTAKRDAIGFTDSIYSEDIGKFADNNIAEAFNRVPGITITRDITGQGVNIAIRGLGTDFTRVLLNG